MDEVIRHLYLSRRQKEIQRQFQARYPGLKKTKGVFEILDAALIATIEGRVFTRKDLAMSLIPEYYGPKTIDAPVKIVDKIIANGFLELIYPNRPRGPLMLAPAYYDSYVGHIKNLLLEAEFPSFRIRSSAAHAYTSSFLHTRENIITEILDPLPPEIIRLRVGDNAFKIAHSDNIEKRGGQRDAQKETENTYDRLLQGGAPINVEMLANSPTFEPVRIKVHVDLTDTIPPLKWFKFYVIDHQELQSGPDACLYFNHRNMITQIVGPWSPQLYRPQEGASIFTLSHPDNIKRRGGIDAIEKEATISFERLLNGGEPIRDSTEVKQTDGSIISVRVIVDLMDTSPPMKRLRVYLPKKFTS